MAEKTSAQLAKEAEERSREKYAEGLRIERDGYLRTGRPARANECAAELRRIGEKCADVEVEETETETENKGGGRRR